MRMSLFILLILFSMQLTNAQTHDSLTIYLDIIDQRPIESHTAVIDALDNHADSLDVEITHTADDSLPHLEIQFSNRDNTDVLLSLYPANTPSSLLTLDATLHFGIDAPQATIDQQLQSAIAYLSGQCEHIAPMLATLAINCAIQTGDFEAAITTYERLELSADNATHDDLHRNMAWVYLQQQRPEDAFGIVDSILADYEQHLSSDAPTPEGYVTTLAFRAELHALNFDYDSAIADMDTAITLEPENPALHVQRGQMVLLLYEWDRVEDDYNMALAIDPDYAPAYYYRGLLLYTVLEREAALADFEAYLEREPDGALAAQAHTYANAIRTELDAISGD